MHPFMQPIPKMDKNCVHIVCKIIIDMAHKRHGTGKAMEMDFTDLPILNLNWADFLSTRKELIAWYQTVLCDSRH